MEMEHPHWNYPYNGYAPYMYGQGMQTNMGQWSARPPRGPGQFYPRMGMPTYPSMGSMQPSGGGCNEGGSVSHNAYGKNGEMPPLPDGLPPPSVIGSQATPPPPPPPPIITESDMLSNSDDRGGIRFPLLGKRPSLGISPLGGDLMAMPSKKKKKKKPGQLNRLKQYLRDNGIGMDAGDPSTIPVPGEVPPAPMPPTQPSQDTEKPIVFPKSLERYINKCFQQATIDADKDKIQAYLRTLITTEVSNGTLYSKDWDKETVPSVLAWGCSKQPDNEVEFIRSIPPPQYPSSSGLSKPTAWVRASSPLRSSAPSNSSPPKHTASPRGKAKGFGRNRFSRSDSSNSSRSRSRSRSRSPARSSSRRRKSHRSEGRKSPQIRLSSKRKDRKDKPRKSSGFYSEGGASFTADQDMGSNEKLQKRLARFSLDAGSKKPQAAASPAPSLPQPPIGGFVVDEVEAFDITKLHVVGTCLDIEKKYFRLTTNPDPSAIRTVDTLKESLKMVKKHWIDRRDYHYACDQLRSIRQDLTVQGVRDAFMIHVYETHARLAMESKDHEEFNQCQNQLKELYLDLGGDNMKEFISYRILYCIFTSNNLDMVSILGLLTPEDKEDDCIKFSLAFRSAWVLKNYHKMFKLYSRAPRMCSYLVDWFLEKLRSQALKVMLKAFRQTIPLTFVQNELSFEQLADARTFLDSFNVKYSDKEKSQIDCKSSWSVVSTPQS